MKLINDKQDLLTTILVAIWLVMLIFLWVKFGSIAASICNFIWIMAFVVLCFLKDFNKSFRAWLYTPLKKE